MYKKKNGDEEDYNGLKLIFNSVSDTLYEIKKDEKDEDKDIINNYEAKNCPEHLKDNFRDFIRYHIRIKQELFSIENKKETNNENYKINLKNENKINIIKNISTSNSIKSEEKSNSIASYQINNNISINNSKDNEKKLVYIKNYVIKGKKNNKFFLLSDGTKQIIFYDKEQIIISDKKGLIGHINAFKKQIILPIDEALNNTNKNFVSKLRHIRRANEKEMWNKVYKKCNTNINKENEENENHSEIKNVPNNEEFDNDIPNNKPFINTISNNGEFINNIPNNEGTEYYENFYYI